MQPWGTKDILAVSALRKGYSVPLWRALEIVERRHHTRARRKITAEVKAGRLARANAFACYDCGHEVFFPEDTPHEWDHYAGYFPEHYLSVQAVCRPCHYARRRHK
jgi:hypothetical protein